MLNKSIDVWGVVSMNDTLDFGLRDKVAIVAGGGAVGKEIVNGRELLYN